MSESFCMHKNARPAGSRYCMPCRARYMRRWRQSHPLEEGEKRKANARSYARTYLRRGKIKRQPCERCGDDSAEMHHDDYGKPLDVRWLCRPCHLGLHAAIRATGTR